MTPWQIAGNDEHSIQTAFVAWCRKARHVGFALAWKPESYETHPAAAALPVDALDLLHAIPNGGDRNKAVANKLKAEGVRPGVPDIFLPHPGRFGYGLYLEFKTATGTASKPQNDFMAAVRAAGYGAVIVRRWDEAARIVEQHLAH